jgi:hypothetical protein
MLRDYIDREHKLTQFHTSQVNLLRLGKESLINKLVREDLIPVSWTSTLVMISKIIFPCSLKGLTYQKKTSVYMVVLTIKYANIQSVMLDTMWVLAKCFKCPYEFIN